MENVVPGALQRLRAADIIRMAGLTAASLGQEYSRIGAVHNTQRQNASISGVVDISHSITSHEAPLVEDGEQEEEELEALVEAAQRHYPVEVAIQSPTTWTSSCLCSPNSSLLCSHAAALLYQWLARPASFITPTEPPASPAQPTLSQQPASSKQPMLSKQEDDIELPGKVEETVAPAITKPAHMFKPTKPGVVQRDPVPLSNQLELLTQWGLSDLRAIAREYDITTNGMNKQQLAEAILEALKQPEGVRRVAATLEKPQRQLLAALSLAGGVMNDDDLRGLYERFSLGQPAQYQGVLVALQGKGMLFRTSLNSSSQQRIGLSGSLLDVGWFVPHEVRAALRVMAPVTLYAPGASQEEVQRSEPFQLLADLLLVARALDGYRLENDEQWLERNATPSRLSGSLASDGSSPIPLPPDTPSPALLAMLQSILPRPTTFLRFVVRLLRLADILHKDDGGTPNLRALPDAAQLLLGSARAEVARDLFELWLTQASYEELFELQEEGLRLRCRATALNLPVIKAGELEAENSEARQLVISLLEQVPPNQWISFPAFARFVYRLNPLFLQKRQRLFSSPHWWLEQEKGRPLRPLQLTDWSRAEVHYLARLLNGPLHWWGAADTVLAADGRLLAFRLTPIAGWLFDHSALEKEEPAEQNYQSLAASLEVLDAEEVLVTCSSQAWPVIDLMETFAEAAGVLQGRLRYRLTPKALGEAISRGERPVRLLELLRHIAAENDQGKNPLQGMLTQLERWIASYGRVRLYTGVTLLETADAVVMRELTATTSLNEQIVQTIHPTALILKKPGAEQIIDDLKRRGQSPLLHDEDLYGAE